MPHIPQQNYEQASEVPEDEGELTYGLYALVCEYAILRALEGDRGLRYPTICAVRGSLVGALDEFNRLVAHPYEDTAIARNGDATPERLRQLLVEAQRKTQNPNVILPIPGTEAQMQMECPTCGCVVGFVFRPGMHLDCPNCKRRWTVEVTVT